MTDPQATTLGESMISGPPPAGAWVLVAVGSGDLRVFPIPASAGIVIGRGAECDVILDHLCVSRRHARVRVAPAGDACLVEDLGSRNGTRVGEALVPREPRILRAGDAIGVGPFTLVAVCEAEAGPPPASLVVEDPRGTEPTAVLASVARSAASVLIRGESGAGKQVLAGTLHRLSGRPGALVSINCAAIGGELLESELFGHERGAFTGAVAAKRGLLEIAGSGTVLLDEIGDMPAAMQAKLLRAVESREVLRVGATHPTPIQARFVSATHRDLLADVEAGRFRLDLYYRLAGVTLELPPLRERPARIVRLAHELLAAAAARDGRPVPAMSAAAIARLQGHDWPGNVRELRNVLDRALILAGDAIGAEHVMLDVPRARTAGPEARRAEDRARSAIGAAEADERRRILDALEGCSGNQTRAAKLLGISRSTLATKLAIHRLPRPRK